MVIRVPDCIRNLLTISPFHVKRLHLLLSAKLKQLSILEVMIILFEITMSSSKVQTLPFLLLFFFAGTRIMAERPKSIQIEPPFLVLKIYVIRSHISRQLVFIFLLPYGSPCMHSFTCHCQENITFDFVFVLRVCSHNQVKLAHIMNLQTTPRSHGVDFHPYILISCMQLGTEASTLCVE